jgi:hypothetical protein
MPRKMSFGAGEEIIEKIKKNKVGVLLGVILLLVVSNIYFASKSSFGNIKTDSAQPQPLEDIGQLLRSRVPIGISIYPKSGKGVINISFFEGTYNPGQIVSFNFDRSKKGNFDHTTRIPIILGIRLSYVPDIPTITEKRYTEKGKSGVIITQGRPLSITYDELLKNSKNNAAVTRDGQKYFYLDLNISCENGITRDMTKLDVTNILMEPVVKRV